MNITNAEYIELVQAIVDELRPDQPVRVGVNKVTDPRTKKVSEKLSIALDLENGTKTEVIFNKGDVLGLGELPLRAFITTKLTSIGVHPAEVRVRGAAPNVTDVNIERDTPTDAEAAKIRELLAKRKPAVPVESYLEVEGTDEYDPTNPVPGGGFFEGPE